MGSSGNIRKNAQPMTKSVIKLMIVIILCVAAGAYLMIFNIFNISLMNDIQYLLLASVKTVINARILNARDITINIFELFFTRRRSASTHVYPDYEETDGQKIYDTTARIKNDGKIKEEYEEIERIYGDMGNSFVGNDRKMRMVALHAGSVKNELSFLHDLRIFFQITSLAGSKN